MAEVMEVKTTVASELPTARCMQSSAGKPAGGTHGTDAEPVHDPADTLSCRRQTNPENAPNLALSLTVPTLDPLTDRAIFGGALPDGPRFSRVDSPERWFILPILMRSGYGRFSACTDCYTTAQYQPSDLSLVRSVDEATLNFISNFLNK